MNGDENGKLRKMEKGMFGALSVTHRKVSVHPSFLPSSPGEKKKCLLLRFVLFLGCLVF